MASFFAWAVLAGICSFIHLLIKLNDEKYKYYPTPKTSVSDFFSTWLILFIGWVIFLLFLSLFSGGSGVWDSRGFHPG